MIQERIDDKQWIVMWWIDWMWSMWQWRTRSDWMSQVNEVTDGLCKLNKRKKNTFEHDWIKEKEKRKREKKKKRKRKRRRKRKWKKKVHDASEIKVRRRRWRWISWMISPTKQKRNAENGQGVFFSGHHSNSAMQIFPILAEFSPVNS